MNREIVTDRRLIGGSLAAGVVLLAVTGGLDVSDGAPGRLPADAMARYDRAQDRSLEPMRCEPIAYVGRDADRCAFEGPDGASRILVWGDSHAPLKAAALAQAGWSVTLRAFPSCPVIAPLGNALFEDGRGCDAHNEAVLAELSADPPDVVLLAGRFDHYLHRFDRAVTAPALTEGWRTVADALNGTDTRLALLAQQPEFDDDPATFALKAAILGETERSHLAAIRNSADVVAFGRAFDELASGTGLPVIDSTAFFCRAETCSANEDGLLLYSDDNHINVDGATFISEPLANAVRALLATDETGRDAAVE